VPSEQAFEDSVDIEHLFVLEYQRSEQVFGKGAAVSVALELEYEAFYPRLRVVPEPPRRLPSRRVQHRRLLLGLVAVGLLVLLALPIRAIGGHTIAGSAPAAGQVYGDSLTSIARQVAPDHTPSLVLRLAAETGSSTIVPGEHLLIP
jgi:hypothetical protein